jgi:aryl-phospho-beta-D-glucosidase BglC (GH1 family)
MQITEQRIRLRGLKKIVKMKGRMKTIGLNLAAVVLWGICGVPLLQASPDSTRFVHAQERDLVAPDGSRLLLRGINLGNWLEPEGYMFGLTDGPQSPREIEALVNELIGPVEAERFWREYRERYITEEDFRFLAQTGINSIRVPLHYKYFLPGDEEGFELVDRVVGWAAKYHLYVILDLHCAPGGQTGANIDDSWGYPWLYESEADQKLTIDVWKRIASHYSNNATVLGYDLLNEPIPHYPQLRQYNERLEPLYKKITGAIRTVDRNHVVILGGAQWDSNFDVFGPPFDKNVVYTFHKYWTDPTEAVIRPYLDFRDRYRVPIWLGESGENTDAWIKEFVEVLEKNEVGWAFWPYKKINATSSFVTWAKPRYWDEVMAYAKMPGSLGETEKRVAARPSLDHSRAALAGLLEAIKFRHCTANAGYLQALGLKVPERAEK